MIPDAYAPLIGLAVTVLLCGVLWLMDLARGRIRHWQAVLAMLGILLGMAAWRTYLPPALGSPTLFALLLAFWLGYNTRRPYDAAVDDLLDAVDELRQYRLPLRTAADMVDRAALVVARVHPRPKRKPTPPPTQPH